VVEASQFGTQFLTIHPPRDALDGNHVTIQHTEGTGIHFWKVVFDKRIYIRRIRIVHRLNCCPERGNDLSVKATVVNAGSRVERICARIDVLGLEKTVDCNEYADELEIFRDYSTALSINLADVYFYGKICFD